LAQFYKSWNISNKKTRFDFKPYAPFIQSILPQLHALKDSGRNKVSHMDGKIVPTDLFTEEMAAGVYDATLLLMKKLATGLYCLTGGIQWRTAPQQSGVSYAQ
jgi:hypothetical protein